MPSLSIGARILLGIISAAAGVLTGILTNALWENITYQIANRPDKPDPQPARIWIVFFVSAFLFVVLGTIAALAPTSPSPIPTPLADIGPISTAAPVAEKPADEHAPQTVEGTHTPTSTPTHTSTPTSTVAPSPTSTPTPDPRLFYDDFQAGIKPEWDISGDNFTVVDGMLVSEGLLEAYVGDNTWTNYSVQMKILNRPSWKVILRRQDRDNYMMFRCYSTWGMYYECYWTKVAQGQEQEVPGTLKGYGDSRIKSTSATLRIEVENDAYRVFWDGEPTMSFFDTTIESGGFGLRLNGGLKLDDIQVARLP